MTELVLHYQREDGEPLCGDGLLPEGVTLLPGLALGRAFALEACHVTCPGCLEALRLDVLATPLLARLAEVLDAREAEATATARTAWLAGGALVVRDRKERLLVEDLELPGLRVFEAADVARRGILLTSGYALYLTPGAGLRLAELGAATREA